MNREIKFRGWQPDIDEMFEFDMWIPWEAEDKQGNTFYTKNMEIMQYTGLKDKNGKEIYFDCSVFNFKYTDADGSESIFRGSITFNIEEQRSEVDVYNDTMTVCLYFDVVKMSDFEVIGNIHENKELLDE